MSSLIQPFILINTQREMQVFNSDVDIHAIWMYCDRMLVTCYGCGNERSSVSTTRRVTARD